MALKTGFEPGLTSQQDIVQPLNYLRNHLNFAVCTLLNFYFFLSMLGISVRPNTVEVGCVL